MTTDIGERDLAERVKLIESMMAEGRRTTESWGWTFVLWGVAYFVATAWATWGKSNVAWPVTMVAAGTITGVIAARMGRGHPETTLGRAIGAVWSAMGGSLFVVLLSLGFSGRYDEHVFIAIIGGMLAVANGASAIVLKWKMQFACAVVWLASAVIASFGSETATSIAFLGATFLCQIVFGIYAMICDARRRRQSDVVHA